jgi:hypothetical protein
MKVHLTAQQGIPATSVAGVRSIQTSGCGWGNSLTRSVSRMITFFFFFTSINFARDMSSLLEILIRFRLKKQFHFQHRQ